MPCESALQQYFAAMDGAEKSFSEFEHHFDAIFHEDYEMISRHGKVISREDVKTVHKWSFSLGMRVTFLHFKKIGSNCLDIKYFSQVPANPLTMKIIHVVHQIEGNILVRSHMVDDSVVDHVIQSIRESYGNRNNNGTTRGAKRKLECLNSGT